MLFWGSFNFCEINNQGDQFKYSVHYKSWISPHSVHLWPWFDLGILSVSLQKVCGPLVMMAAVDLQQVWSPLSPSSLCISGSLSSLWNISPTEQDNLPQTRSGTSCKIRLCRYCHLDISTANPWLPSRPSVQQSLELTWQLKPNPSDKAPTRLIPPSTPWYVRPSLHRNRNWPQDGVSDQKLLTFVTS